MSNNKRNEKKSKKSLKAKRKSNAVSMASTRWSGMAKILGLISRGPVAVVRTAPAVNRMAAAYSL